ncbi:outer membrane protein with beta-barrel domain [Orenia metallireducens]|uniref:Outer membrane protein beta-barrel domain-containing protein n=1 Tax=Orenia metallireducens TaxID=1413210 RepID=A0A285GEP9_9FIRM|nr:outer membrane beta-barrel protein [Orenia metallireducens]PRX32560.1 outer membrane protein with beta-barrel domain [Orenia metallireducens]SNY20841.1 Outer membrane protein beta-barrel domain-containing protein [Orenia metallireducens]
MKTKNIIIMPLLIFCFLASFNSSTVNAMSQAEVDKGDSSLAYGMQVLDGEIRALNLETEFGISTNFGIEGIYTYIGDDDDENENDILDVNTKFNLIDNSDYDVSAVLGYHTDFEDGYPRIGILYSKSENKLLDLNLGIDVLLKKDKSYLGYMLGFDYRLTDNIYLEVGHRKFSGQEDTEGLNIGTRYYF